jgi:hypothetical protein
VWRFPHGSKPNGSRDVLPGGTALLPFRSGRS